MLDINGMGIFFNEDVPSQEEDDVWDEPYQVLPDSPDMEYDVNQYNYEKYFDTYDQFVGAEVYIPGEQVRK